MTSTPIESPGGPSPQGPQDHPRPDQQPPTGPDGDRQGPQAPDDKASDARSSDPLGKLIEERARGAPGQAEGIAHDRRFIVQIGNLITGGSFRVAGDILGGDKTVPDTDAAPAVGEAVAGLSAALELEKLEAVFVEPDEYPRAARILGEQRLVLLRGPAGNGKRAMALHLLMRQGARRVIELSPETEPAKLATYPFAAQFGYLIDTLLPELARQLSSFMLRRLGAGLSDRNSYLILTIDQGPEVPPEVARDHLVDCQDVPDPEAMLRRHLAWYLRGTIAGSGEHPEVGHAEVTEYLRLHPRPVSVDRLARLLRPVVLGEQDFATALRQARSVPSEQAASIFASDPDLAQWSLIVAVAVLHSASYQTVLGAAEQLVVRLRHDLKHGGRREAWEPGIPRLQRISQAKARLVDDREMVQYGSIQVERVEFEHPELQPAVLDHVWQRYDQLRRPLLDWLRELGEEDAPEVRIGAATALGYLLPHAFRHLFNEVLLPWAHSDNKAARTTAAWAFGVPIRHPQLAPVVLAVLSDWADPGADWRLRWTAAESYGRAVGALHPEAALRDLRLIGRTPDDGLLNWVAGHGISHLAVNDRLAESIGALLDWTNPGAARPLRTAGLIGFCELALRVDASPKIPGHSPVLLEQAADGVVSRDAVEELWRRVLNAAVTVDYAARALRGWLRAADREREHLDAAQAHLEPWLRQLLVDLLAGHTAVAQRLRQLLRRRAGDPDRPSLLARNVISGQTTRETA
jgi:hypothetical protein